MTPGERQAQLTELLASAYLRLLASREESRNPLALSGESKPSCAPVNGGESSPGKEPA
jgi:hypothetical protein